MSNVIDITGQGFTLQPGLLPAMRLDARALKAHRERLNAQKFDAAAPGLGFHLARDLEFKYAEVLREEFPPQSAFEAFPIDTSVPAGAKSHTVRRLHQQGEAKVFRGNSTDVPRVGVTQEEEEFPVRHYVVGIGLNIFEEQASNFANSNLRGELQTAAQVTMQEFANHKTWFGDEENGIHGVLNYPWIHKRVVSTPFSQGADAKAVLAALNESANYQHEESKTVYSPNAMITSPRILRILRTLRVDPTHPDKVLDDFLASNPRIQSVSGAWELQGTGPGGTDIILFYRRDKRSVANVMVKPFTMLPVQQKGFEMTIPCYMSHGGVIMRDVLNNNICYVEAE